MINKLNFTLKHIPESTKFSIAWKYDLYLKFLDRDFEHGERTVIYKEIADKHKFIAWKTVEQYARTVKFKEMLEDNEINHYFENLEQNTRLL